jgi:transposase InsO family protein
MARDGVAVQAEFAAAVASYAAGERFDVTARCVLLGVSRETFYKYLGRFRTRGVPGLYPYSRRPGSSPTRLAAALEEVLLRIRKEEAHAGWDYGADAVLMRLEEQVLQDPDLWPAGRRLPSRSTVNRVFDAAGVLTKVPARRPKPRPNRFARERTNELWQYDGFETKVRCPTGDLTTVVVLHLSDDCSRTDLGLQAVVSENGPDVWDAFCRAASQYGLPAAVLHDNGTAFTGQRRGSTSQFEHNLAVLGIESISSSVNHPQTCGKNERAHQRIHKWLSRRPLPRSIGELQMLLDTYQDAFNNRRNRVLDGLTPHQRLALGPLAGPGDQPRPAPTHLTWNVVSSRGAIGIDKTLIGLGRRYAGHQAIAFRTGDHVAIFIDDHLVRELTLDRTRHYQPQDHHN